jgi:2-polyprenyl-3-methyl-5-hydroxy-6-metoxy-1,4-benzoquinol methylase
MKAPCEMVSPKRPGPRNAGAIKLILRMLMRMDNLGYKLISKFATKAEGGTHPKHRLTEYHDFFLHHVEPDDSVLDIGCGNGLLTYDVASKARNVTAIDIDERNIEWAKRNHNKENIRYLCGDATQLRFVEKFDVIILSNVLEHIEDRHDFLSTGSNVE